MPSAALLGEMDERPKYVRFHPHSLSARVGLRVNHFAIQSQRERKKGKRAHGQIKYSRTTQLTTNGERERGKSMEKGTS